MCQKATSQVSGVSRIEALGSIAAPSGRQLEPDADLGGGVLRDDDLLGSLHWSELRVPRLDRPRPGWDTVDVEWAPPRNHHIGAVDHEDISDLPGMSPANDLVRLGLLERRRLCMRGIHAVAECGAGIAPPLVLGHSLLAVKSRQLCVEDRFARFNIGHREMAGMRVPRPEHQAAVEGSKLDRAGTVRVLAVGIEPSVETVDDGSFVKRRVDRL